MGNKLIEIIVSVLAAIGVIAILAFLGMGVMMTGMMGRWM